MIPPPDLFHIPAALLAEVARCCLNPCLDRAPIHCCRCRSRFQSCLPEREQPPARSCPFPRSCQPHRGPRVSSSSSEFKVTCVRRLLQSLSLLRSFLHVQLETWLFLSLPLDLRTRLSETLFRNPSASSSPFSSVFVSSATLPWSMSLLRVGVVFGRWRVWSIYLSRLARAVGQ